MSTIPPDEPRAPESPAAQSHRRVRPLLAALAAVLPLLPIAVAVVALGGASTRATAGTTTTPPVTKYFHPLHVTKLSKAPDLFLPPGNGSLVGLVEHATTMRAGPGRGATIARVPTHTVFGSSMTFWVVKLKGSWAGVISNLAGNNRVGWVPASAVVLSRDNWELHAVLGKRQINVLHNGKKLYTWPIAVGKPTAPTPTGRFAVTDRLRTGDPEGSYGCCILATSATAPHAIADWYGGNRIAVHSTPETDSIGLPVSHGCMRLSIAHGRWLLAHIPLGTPVIVSSA